MCGIIALIQTVGTVDLPLFAAMRDTLTHRGPDAAGLWASADGRIALGHRRLSILDRSDAANQPMTAVDGRLRIVFNGEIYNYVELREELVAKGSVFQTTGDTEVLLEALRVWGYDALAKLNGMFAFALLDERRGRLLLVRDRFGEKPLFYATLPGGGGLAAASEMKALLAYPGFGRQLDEATLTRYLGGSYYEDEPETLFAGIKRIPPATAMEFDLEGKQLREWRFWTPDYESVRDIGVEDAVGRFQELLVRSVKLRLRSDVPVGTSLSGGLDSSTLVGIVAGERQAGTPITQNTFSARFDADPTMSEGPEIDKVVAFTGVSPYATTPDPVRLMEESQKLHWHQEEPFLSASIYLQWCVARLAKETGTVVLIDGQGADELLGGYQFYFKHHQLDLLDQRRFAAALWESYRFSSRLRRAAKAYADSKRRFNDEVAYKLHEVAGLAVLGAPPHGSGVPRPGLPTVVPGGRCRRIMAEALNYNTLPQLLRYADRNSMAFSREARLPFLDNELVAFSNALPDDLFFRDGWQKYVLRRAADGYTPDAIRWRADKMGYAAPQDVWMRGALKEWSYENLFSDDLAVSPGYDAATLRAQWNAHQSGEANNSWPLWRWISLSEWLRLNKTDAWSVNVTQSNADEAQHVAVAES